MKAIVLILSLATAGLAEIVTTDVDYKQGDTALQGFHAYDDGAEEKRPGILIVHQWTGLTDYEKRRAGDGGGDGWTLGACWCRALAGR